jgi:radical SAM-linked protein
MAYLQLLARKTGNLRFLSHLETHKMLERSLRRARVPLAFSHGFNPHPNISFAAPLPVGSLSDYEVVHVELAEAIDTGGLIRDQRRFFPEEFILLKGKILEKPPSLMKEVVRSDYTVTLNLPVSPREIEEGIREFLSRETHLIRKRTKKGRYNEVDIRPQVKDLAYDQQADSIFMSLDTGSVSNLKPLVLMEELFDFPPEKLDIKREKLYKTKDGELVELY